MGNHGWRGWRGVRKAPSPGAPSPAWANVGHRTELPGRRSLPPSLHVSAWNRSLITIWKLQHSPGEWNTCSTVKALSVGMCSNIVQGRSRQWVGQLLETEPTSTLQAGTERAWTTLANAMLGALRLNYRQKGQGLAFQEGLSRSQHGKFLSILVTVIFLLASPVPGTW
jgi:hypothetical protein